jgi:DNA-binding transcriptional LysR family regulator
LVGPVIVALRQTHPDLQIHLTVGVRSLDIARRESDLAIRLVRPAASELVCRKLGEVGFSLYASQRYLAKLGIPKRGHGLGGYDLITFTGTSRHESVFHGRIIGRCARRDPLR